MTDAFGMRFSWLFVLCVVLSVCVRASETSETEVKATNEHHKVLWLLPEESHSGLAFIFGEENATVLAMPFSSLSVESEYEITISYSSVTPARLTGEFLNTLSEVGVSHNASRTSTSNQIRFVPSNYAQDVTMEYNGVPTKCLAIRMVSAMDGVLNPQIYARKLIPAYVPVDVVLSAVSFGLPQRAHLVMGLALVIVVLTCIVTPIIVCFCWAPQPIPERKPSSSKKQKTQ